MRPHYELNANFDVDFATIFYVFFVWQLVVHPLPIRESTYYLWKQAGSNLSWEWGHKLLRHRPDSVSSNNSDEYLVPSSGKGDLCIELITSAPNWLKYIDWRNKRDSWFIWYLKETYTMEKFITQTNSKIEDRGWELKR